ncbi:hypothetical protein ACWDOP_33960 [Nocardia sp. NPDC003693]
MSAPHERSALEHPDSLFDHITALHLRSPDGPLPEGTDTRTDAVLAQLRRHDSVSYADRRRSLVTALTTFFAEPDAPPERLHRLLTAPDIAADNVSCLRQLFPLPDVEPPTPDRARELGTWLVRYGRDVRPILIGLLLLESTARPEDIPLLRIMALLPCFAERAIAILGTLPGAAFDLVWLATRTRRFGRIGVMSALCEQADPAARQWLLRNAFVTEHPGSSDQARRIAEVTRLADALVEDGNDDAVRDQAITLLVQMTSHRDYRTEIERYPDARRVLTLLADQVPLMVPTAARCAALTALVEDLRTGAAHCLDWKPGERAAVLGDLTRVLRSPAWQATLFEQPDDRDPFAAWRARWVRDRLASPPGASEDHPLREGQSHLEIRVVSPAVPGPGVCGNAETRILVDGHPILVTAFPVGAGGAPELVLDGGGLRAARTPRKVRLATAYCAEGCCGALYVTIVREGDEVVWRDWQTAGASEPPPEFRFAAAAYDREISRAESDTSWEWPARTLSRRIHSELRADPSILARWDCSISWILAWTRDIDLAKVYLMSTTERPQRQFGFSVRVDPADPEAQALALIEALRTIDPREVSRSHDGTGPG